MKFIRRCDRLIFIFIFMKRTGKRRMPSVQYVGCGVVEPMPFVKRASLFPSDVKGLFEGKRAEENIGTYIVNQTKISAVTLWQDEVGRAPIFEPRETPLFSVAVISKPKEPEWQWLEDGARPVCPPAC